MKAFNNSNYPWTLAGLQACIKDNKIKAKILATNGEKAIVKVESYGASQVLGAESDWCISQHECSWKQYVSRSPNNIQIFFFNFDLKRGDNLSLVGATFTMNDDWTSMSLMCCFTRENRPIGEKIKKDASYDLEALNKLIAIPNFQLVITPNDNQLFKCLSSGKPKTKQEKIDEPAYATSRPYRCYWDDWDDFDLIYGG